ncbi:YigZ family protein [Ligilactobacillus salitolerans]|uniref:YigZ family protein n=1 Tax=Ligilactobacillus salitolerans TaxID=1808352 RepID=A0A401IW57_9LACO|nr:YigZ family protein [Ligilactobacillus salitolerans]GBG95752.1 YigZ family protein [Ligilactobacillus salitolerans]
MQPYLTVKTAGSFEIDIKKSRFICNIARTETQEEAEDFIAHIKQKHASANHNCYAYVLGMKNEVVKQNDNGEPSGTAGKPILNVLQQLELRNVTAVVTRYFGGIKLGAGGLIRAYSNSTSQTIEQLGIVARQPQTEAAITIAYPLQGKLTNFLEKQQLSIIDTQFTDQVTITIAINTADYAAKTAAINDFLNAQATFTKGQEKYHELPWSTKDQPPRY